MSFASYVPLDIAMLGVVASALGAVTAVINNLPTLSALFKKTY
jgi:hypothetical protein